MCSSDLNIPRIKPDEVATVPIPVIVPFPRMKLGVPLGVTRAELEVELQVQMRPILANGGSGVGAAPHDGNGLAHLHLSPDLNRGVDSAQVRIERMNTQAVDRVTNDEVGAVVGENRRRCRWTWKLRPPVDGVGHRMGRRRGRRQGTIWGRQLVGAMGERDFPLKEIVLRWSAPQTVPAG